MATGAKSKAARKKTPRKKTPGTVNVIDLKAKSATELKRILERAQRARIGFVILNAPFKVRPRDVLS